MARNPKDVIVSFYHHHKLMKMQGFSGGSLENFADFFMKDQGKCRVLSALLYPSHFIYYLV